LKRWLTVMTAWGAGMAWSPPAEACGGMFCSNAPTVQAPQPVDQNAERIVFEVSGDRITAHIQIQYAGGADSFAWVVPVEGVPEVAESPFDFIASVDRASALQLQLPQPLPCAFSNGGGDGFSCGCGDSDDASSPNPPRGSEVHPPVTVYGQSSTRNYEYAIVGAERSEDLVAWLQNNEYNVSDNMVPLMEPYTLSGMNFLALKLRNGRSVSEIAPIQMSYRGHAPMIPIQLTAVAAQPLMGILVMILADEEYVPQNYGLVVPNAREILYDAQGNTSYFEWVARKAAEADGQLFVAEYAGWNNTNVVTSTVHSRLSRYYTRLSPEHMMVDPVFVPGNAPEASDGRLDLSSGPPVLSCFSPIPEAQPSPCAFNYCGPDATCVAGATIACLCPEGRVAQPIRGPDGTQKVTCVPEANPFGVTPEAAGVGTQFDVCLGYECGEGRCVSRGGFAACACNPGAGAELDSGGAVRCTVMAQGTQTFGPGAGAESRGVDVRSEKADARSIAIAVLLAAAYSVGRRRKFFTRSR
jgi:hypothetical protein